jgi:hypothetical protein
MTSYDYYDTDFKLKHGSNPHDLPIEESNQLIGELHCKLEYIREERDHMWTQMRDIVNSPRFGESPCETKVLGNEGKILNPKIVFVSTHCREYAPTAILHALSQCLLEPQPPFKQHSRIFSRQS